MVLIPSEDSSPGSSSITICDMDAVVVAAGFAIWEIIGTTVIDCVVLGGDILVGVIKGVTLDFNNGVDITGAAAIRVAADDVASVGTVSVSFATVEMIAACSAIEVVAVNDAIETLVAAEAVIETLVAAEAAIETLVAAEAAIETLGAA